MKLAFLGDSVTEGCFELITMPNKEIDTIRDPEVVYHAVLKKLIEREFPKLHPEIINAGISGHTAGQGAARLERDILAHSPDIAVVCFGLNDVHSRDLTLYTTCLTKIFSGLKQAQIPTIFLTPNMMSTYAHPGVLPCAMEMARQCAEIQNGGVLDAFVAKGIECAKDFSCTICDTYGHWKRLNRYGVDTTVLLSNYINHPSRPMHRLFADMLFDTLLQDNLLKNA